MTYTVVVPTHSKYIDICNNFFELLEINWKESLNKCVLSVCGDDVSSDVCDTIYNGKEATLTGCVLNAERKYVSDYYLVFLGDAFISQKVNNTEVDKFLNDIKHSNIQYCRLLPQITCGKKKVATKLIRYAKKDERYSHSFVAFAATRDFIENEFASGITDRDFEIKYLQIANTNSQAFNWYEDRAVLLYNIFHIMPGIEKGKWSPHVLKFLKHHFPNILFSNREKVGVLHDLFLKMRILILPYVPNGARIKIKTVLKRILKGWFDTSN